MHFETKLTDFGVTCQVYKGFQSIPIKWVGGGVLNWYLTHFRDKILGHFLTFLGLVDCSEDKRWVFKVFQNLLTYTNSFYFLHLAVLETLKGGRVGWKIKNNVHLS